MNRTVDGEAGVRGDEWPRQQLAALHRGRARDSPKGKTGKLRKRLEGETLWFTLNREAEEEGIGQTQRSNDKSVGGRATEHREDRISEEWGGGPRGPEPRASQKMGTWRFV